MFVLFGKTERELLLTFFVSNCEQMFGLTLQVQVFLGVPGYIVLVHVRAAALFRNLKLEDVLAC